MLPLGTPDRFLICLLGRSRNHARDAVDRPFSPERSEGQGGGEVKRPGVLNSSRPESDGWAG